MVQDLMANKIITQGKKISEPIVTKSFFSSIYYLQLVFANKLKFETNVLYNFATHRISNFFQSKSFKKVFMFVVQRVRFACKMIRLRDCRIIKIIFYICLSCIGTKVSLITFPHITKAIELENFCEAKICQSTTSLIEQTDFCQKLHIMIYMYTTVIFQIQSTTFMLCFSFSLIKFFKKFRIDISHFLLTLKNCK